jgi:hypothetical protein
MNGRKVKAIIETYVGAFVATVVTLYFNGIHSPKALLSTALWTILAPLFRALNPKDLAFGLKTWNLLKAWRNRKSVTSNPVAASITVTPKV